MSIVFKVQLCNLKQYLDNDHSTLRKSSLKTRAEKVVKKIYTVTIKLFSSKLKDIIMKKRTKKAAQSSTTSIYLLIGKLCTHMYMTAGH